MRRVDVSLMEQRVLKFIAQGNTVLSRTFSKQVAFQCTVYKFSQENAISKTFGKQVAFSAQYSVIKWQHYRLQT
jgi:hypothetical protein